MKVFGIILTTITGILLLLNMIFGVIANYQYNKQIKSYWDLADKASTIDKKLEYINKYVEVLENTNLQGKYNAFILETPNNSFDNNFEMLKTLQQRLEQIKVMDIKSFEYQTAIQQITAQEQGEANEMLRVFKGIWVKEHYVLLWNWICLVQVIVTLFLFIFGLLIIDKYYY